MNRILCILLSIFISFSLNAADINEYQMELVAELEVGEQEGKLGYNEELAQWFGVGVIQFTISEKNIFYICDPFNFRLSVFDINFNFIKSISVKYGISTTKKIIIDKNENIISLNHPVGLVKIDKQGNLKFQIKYNKLPDTMKGKKEFFVLQNDVLFYDKSEYIILLNDKGEKKVYNNVLQVLTEYNESIIDSNDNSRTFNSNDFEDKVTKFLEKKKLIKKGNKLLTGNFKNLQEYNETIKSIDRTSETLRNLTDEQYIDIFDKISIYSMELLGYDNNSNSYWESRVEKKYLEEGKIEQLVVVVCSQYGEILDCFYNFNNYESVAVAPNGDIYFRESVPADGKFHFYKITRRW